jgi:3-deoxy-D-manno-octulosonate 8-phosphate phosphatase (KDO 8-P phosphatase)
LGKRRDPDDPTPAVPRIRLFVMDVDGTLTDGTIAYDERGSEWKAFHSRDGAGIRILALAGVIPAILSGRKSEVVVRRAKELGIEEVVQGVLDKAAALRSMRERLEVPANEVAYVGDDLSDLPAMREVAFSAAPADAAEEVRQGADYVCALPGGRGAVREAIETLLKRDGRWDAVLSAFGAKAAAS